MGVVIFAGSFHGKTTAHKKKLGHDCEAPPPPSALNVDVWQVAYDEYKEIENRWKAERIPKDLDATNTAFNAMCIEAYQSDIPVLFSHHSETLESSAKRAGRETRFVLLDYMEIVKRIDSMDEDPGVFRAISAFGYAQGLARRKGNLTLYPTIEKAIASY